jgi:hypothetical protein
MTNANDQARGLQLLFNGLFHDAKPLTPEQWADLGRRTTALADLKERQLDCRDAILRAGFDPDFHQTLIASGDLEAVRKYIAQSHNNGEAA